MTAGSLAFDPDRTTGWRWRRLLPQRADYAGLRRSWRTDVLAGVTVGVVALPLALAFGVTTGLGATAGLVTAVVAGLVTGVFGGSHVQVSGPTGAMTVVLVPIVARYGPGGAATVALLGGLFVLVLGVAGFGRAVSYIPWPVVEGFTLGIAVIIVLQQVPFLLDVPKPHGENTAVVAVRAVLTGGHGLATVEAFGVAALAAAIALVLPKVRRSLPASLIAVAVTTALAEFTHVTVARIGALPSAIPVPRLPDLTTSTVSALFSSAVAVAALAAIESLLSARVADGMADTRRHDADRELVGQGLGNLVAGLFAGMPATGAIARTAVNVRAGARTRVSAVVHSLLLLAVVYLGAALVSRIPLSVLAGILVVTAVRMVERHSLLAVLRSTRADALVFVLTAITTVVFDLVVAVEVGVAVAALLALRSLARASSVRSEDIPVEVDEDAEHRYLHEHIAVFRLSGALFFGAAQRFLDELATVADVQVVVLRLGGVHLLDATGANALREIIRDLESRGITVLLCGATAAQTRVLEAVGGSTRHAHRFTALDAAVAHAREHVRRSTVDVD